MTSRPRTLTCERGNVLRLVGSPHILAKDTEAIKEAREALARDHHSFINFLLSQPRGFELLVTSIATERVGSPADRNVQFEYRVPELGCNPQYVADFLRTFQYARFDLSPGYTGEYPGPCIPVERRFRLTHVGNPVA